MPVDAIDGPAGRSTQRPIESPLRLQRENHIQGSNTTLGYDDVAQPPHLEVDFDMGKLFVDLKERPFENGCEWESGIFFCIFLHSVFFGGIIQSQQTWENRAVPGSLR